MSIDFDDKKQEGVRPQAEQDGLGETQSLEGATLTSGVSRQDYLQAESGGSAFEAVLSGPVTAADLTLDTPGTALDLQVVGVGPQEKMALEILGGLEIPDNLISTDELESYVDASIQETPGALSQIASRLAMEQGRTFSLDEARSVVMTAALRQWSHINGTVNEDSVNRLLGEEAVV